MSQVTEKLPGKFHLAQYVGKKQFEAKHLLCCSDLEALSMQELVDMADDECKALWNTLKLKYTPGEGHPLLRKEVAELYPGFSAGDVYVINPQEGMYVTLKCMVHTLKESLGVDTIDVLCTFPAYQGLYELFRQMNCTLSFWTVKKKPGSPEWTFDLDDLNAMLKDSSKLLIVNFPHNPTSTSPDGDSWRQIVEICKSREMYLFSDEMYRLSNNDGSAPLPAACTMYDRAVSLFGMSKTFGLPGIRIGWLATKDAELLRKVDIYKDYTSTCPPVPSEILAIIALRNCERLLARLREIVRPNLDVLDQFFGAYPEYFEWVRPKACTVGLLELKPALLPPGGATEFCETLLKETGVLVLPASTLEFADRFVRIGFGRKTLPEVITATKKHIEEIKISNKA